MKYRCRHLINSLIAYSILSFPLSAQINDFEGSEFSRGRSLTFSEALDRALKRAPQLNISRDEIGESFGRQIQSRQLPNPIASYSVENVFGVHNWKGWDEAESRYELEQLIELGGKRNYRFQTANYQYSAARAAYEAQKIVVMNHLKKAFIKAVFAQEIYHLAAEQLHTSEEAHKIVLEKVEAGKSSLLQKSKADIAFAASRIEYERAAVDFAKAKEKLSMHWGSAEPDFERVQFQFYELEPPASFECRLDLLKNNPELIRSKLENCAAQQNLNLERAEAVPDLVVTVGYKTLQDKRDKGMILGASIPLPIFDHNEGNIRRARYEKQKAHDKHRALLMLLENKLSASYKELVRVYNEAELLRSTVLTAASQSFEFTREGYREGKFEYLDMIDSQTTFFDVKEKFIHALLNYHQSHADIEYLISQED
jgi:cobalt-zinc-cadmium efflux system outer membrane protein